jgi:type IV secretory pathway TraG/TraD family ATPase VirD4
MNMNAHLYSLTHGTAGLVIAYLGVFAGVIAGLVHARAVARKYVAALLLAVPLLLVVALCTSILSAALKAIGLAGSLIQFIGALAVAMLVGFAGGLIFAIDRSRQPVHRRGAFISNFPVKTARDGSDGAVTLAGIPIPRADESKHFKIIGTTGTGKSTAIREILEAALSRGDRVIIADPDAGYLNRYYDPKRGDVILNPFDPDAHKWNLFGEITEDYDIDELARALIPDSGEDDRIWNEYARTLFSEIIRQMRNSENFDDRELSRLLNKADDEELSMLLEDTAAARFFKEGSEKMLGSTQSVLASAVRVLEYTTRHEAPPLSVRAWVRQSSEETSGGGAVLFLPYKATEISALRRLISTWMRLSIFEAMNGQEGDQRLWFIVDELDALGAIDGLKDALARLRKFGGRCVLGFQSIAQVSGLYGKGAAETIVENCGNTLILRCSASERGGTSEFASKLIGMREVVHTTTSTTRRSGEWRSSTSKSEQLRTEPAIMASEIERLPDLAGFLKIASLPDWHVATLAVRFDTSYHRNPGRQKAATIPVPPSIKCQDDSAFKKQRAPGAIPKPRARTKRTSKSRRQSKSATETRFDGNSRLPVPPPDNADTKASDTVDPR